MNLLLKLALVSPCWLSMAFAADLNLTPAQMQALGVRLEPLQAASSTLQSAYPARFMPAPGQERVISTMQEGLVSRVLVVEGQSVKAGQGLLELQVPALLDQQLALLKANSRLQLAKAALQRYRQLLAEGLIAGKKVIEAEAEAATAEAEERAASTALRLSGLSAAQQQRLLSRQQVDSGLVIQATQSGQVAGLKVTPGQRVQAAEELLRLISASSLWVEADVPAAAAGIFRSGQSVPVGNGAAEAVVVSVAAQSGNAQSVKVRGRLKSSLPGALPGMTTTLGEASAQSASWQLPQTAVTRLDGKTVVFLKAATGFAPVEVQAIGDGRTVRVSGAFKGGELIAVSGVTALRNAWQAER